MHKYVLVAFLNHLQEGTQFSASDWPLHVTLVANFAVDREHGRLDKDLAACLAHTQPAITLTALEDEFFGPNKQVHVTVMETNEALLALHKQVVALLRNKGAIFDEPQYLEDGYRPHVTVQSHDRIHEGDIITIATLSLVDMGPHSSSRRFVLTNFNLGSKAPSSHRLR